MKPIRQLKLWPHGHQQCRCYECRIHPLRVLVRKLARVLRSRLHP